jgi:hypothetical protein
MEILGRPPLPLDVRVDEFDDLDLEASRLGRRFRRQPMVAGVQAEVELVERD